MPGFSVQELSDRAAIHDVIMRYAMSVDQRDWKTFVECFTPDAYAEYSGVAAGPGVEKILAHVKGIEDKAVSTHFMENQLIEVSGDVATVETYASSHLPWKQGEGPTFRVRGLRYESELVRQDGRWRIRRHTHGVDWERFDEGVMREGDRQPRSPTQNERAVPERPAPTVRPQGRKS